MPDNKNAMKNYHLGGKCSYKETQKSNKVWKWWAEDAMELGKTSEIEHKEESEAKNNTGDRKQQ